MKLNYSLYLILIFSMIACGVRNDEQAYINPLIGNWKLSGIECYYPDLGTGSIKEIYSINPLDTNEVNFNGRVFVYTVSEGGGGSCNTSANGNYVLSYDNTEEGRISYTGITNSLSCSITHSETTGATSGDIPYGFITSSENTTDLDWRVSGTTLTLEMSNGYKGTALGSFCSSSCSCYGKYTKDGE